MKTNVVGAKIKIIKDELKEVNGYLLSLQNGATRSCELSCEESVK
jgi:hypothetical protein